MGREILLLIIIVLALADAVVVGYYLGKKHKVVAPISSECTDTVTDEQWGLTTIQWQVAKQRSKKIVVAVIDTGIDLNHPDLKNVLWRNHKEIPNNGIDDDGNGFVDDYHGWNFVKHNHDLKDNHGHGTHIAGIIGAEASNGIGISGVADNVEIMVLKYYDDEVAQTNNLHTTIEAIRYATEMGADIINYSGGGDSFSNAEYQVIEEARRKGIIVVAAAGNEHANANTFPFYPASYNHDNIISVTAIDKKIRILETSNFGLKTVDIAAPGEDIYSTKPDNSYETMSGTSQATAFVSGAVALAWGRYPQFNARQIKAFVISSAKLYKHLDKTIEGGWVLIIKNILINSNRQLSNVH